MHQIPKYMRIARFSSIAFALTFVTGCYFEIGFTPSTSQCYGICPTKWREKDINSLYTYRECRNKLSTPAINCLNQDYACQSDSTSVSQTGTAQCEEQYLTTSSSSSSSSSSTDTSGPKTVAFRVYKYNAASDYASVVDEIMTSFPENQISATSIKDNPKTGRLSYQRLAAFSNDNSGLMTTVVSSSDVRKSKFIRYNDNWAEIGTNDTVKRKDPCGSNYTIRSLYAHGIKYDKSAGYDAGTSITYDELEWSQNLLTSNYIAKLYDSTYVAGKSDDFTVVAFLLDSRDVWIEKVIDGDSSHCSEYTIDENEAATLKSLGGIAANYVNNHYLSTYAAAIQLPGTHTFPIAIFMDEIGSMAMMPTGCSSSESSLFENILSHEIGHQIITSGHDPDTSKWMAATPTCQTTQTIPFKPTAATTSEFPVDAASDTSNVTGMKQQILNSVSPSIRWVP